MNTPPSIGQSLSRLPALPCAAGMVAGILTASYGLGLWAIAIGSAAFAMAAFARKRYLSFLMLMVAVGAALATAHAPQSVPNALCGKAMRFSGIVIEAEPGANSTRCVFRLDSCDGHAITPFKCVASVREFTPGLAPGARVEANATLINPDESNLVPYETDYQRYLKYDGIACRAWLYPVSKDGPVLRRGDCLAVTKPASGWRYGIYALRSRLADAIVDAPVNGPTAGLLLATILGDDTYLDDGVREAFSAVGLSHALALSGLHVGVLAGLLSFLLFPTRFFRVGFYLRPVLTGLLIWGYAIITGMGPSVARAAAMLSVFIAARLLQRGSNPFNSLCVAAVAVLALNPYSLFTPGFQLSFAAVLAILLFCRVEPRWLRRRPILRFAVGLFAVPVAAMLGTGMLSAYYFHALPWLFIPANLLAGLCLPALLTIGVLLMLLTLCGLQFIMLGMAANGLTWLLTAWAGWLSSLGAQSTGIFFTPWAIAPYMAALLMAGLAIRRKRWTLWVCTAAMLAASVLIATWTPQIPNAELYAPRGRGSALLLQSGGQARLVAIDDNIDSAAVLDEYTRRFQIFLLSRRCDTLRFMADGEQLGPYYYSQGIIVAGDNTITIATSRIPRIPTHYTIIGQGFTADPAALPPADTIYLTPTLPSPRAKTLLQSLPSATPLPLHPLP